MLSCLSLLTLFVLAHTFHPEVCATASHVPGTVDSPETYQLLHTACWIHVSRTTLSFVGGTTVGCDSADVRSLHEAEELGGLTNTEDGFICHETEKLCLTFQSRNDCQIIENRGAAGGIEVHCSASGHVLAVRGFYVTVVCLLFSGFNAAPAIEVDGRGRLSLVQPIHYGDDVSLTHRTEYSVGVLWKDCTLFSGGDRWDSSLFVDRICLSVIDSSFSENSAVDGGPVLAANSTFSIGRTGFDLNSVQDAGSVLSINSSFRIRTRNFMKNVANRYDVVLHADSGSHLRLEHCSLSENSDVNRDGCIGALQSTAVVRNSRLPDNTSASGGAVSLQERTRLRVFGPTSQKNSAVAEGATYAMGSEVSIVRRNRCSAHAEHGGITYSQRSKLFFVEFNWALNVATSEGGSVLYLENGSRVQLSNWPLKENSAKDGGGNYAISSTIELAQARFWRNRAQVGGGIYIPTHVVLITMNGAASSIAFERSRGHLERWIIGNESRELEFKKRSQDWILVGSGAAQFVPLRIKNLTDTERFVATGYKPFLRREHSAHRQMARLLEFDPSRDYRMIDASKQVLTSEINSELDAIDMPAEEILDADIQVLCAEGYTGILCGACDSDYSRHADGSCSKCGFSPELSRLMATALGMAFVIMSIIKATLTVNNLSSWTVAESEFDEERTAVIKVAIATTPQHSPVIPTQHGRIANATSCPYSDEGTSSKKRSLSATTSTHSCTVSEISEEGICTADSHSDGGGSFSGAKRIEVSGNGKDPNITPPKSSSTAKKASSALSNIFATLFNYAQLNSLVFTAEVAQKRFMKNFLAVQAMLGSVFSVHMLPIGCCLSDRGDDQGIPNSIVTLLIHIGISCSIMMLYPIIFRIYLLSLKNESEYELKEHASLATVALVVFLSHNIDIISNSLRIVDCVDLTPYSDAHDSLLAEAIPRARVWREDTNVVCFQGAHLVISVLAAVGLTLVFCVYLFAVYIVYHGVTRKKLRCPRFIVKYGFLYLPYNTEGFGPYWEAVVVCRTALLAIAVETGRREVLSGDRMGPSTMILFGFHALQMAVKPFADGSLQETFPSYAGSALRYFKADRLAESWVQWNQSLTLNGLESASVGLSLSIFILAASVNGYGSNTVLSNLMTVVPLFLNVVFVLFMLYRLWCGLHYRLDVWVKDHGTALDGDCFLVGRTIYNPSHCSLVSKVCMVLSANFGSGGQCS